MNTPIPAYSDSSLLPKVGPEQELRNRKQCDEWHYDPKDEKRRFAYASIVEGVPKTFELSYEELVTKAEF